MPHLIGIGHTRAEVRALLEDYEAVGVTEVLDHGAPSIHLYTLNVPEAAEGVLDRLGPAAFRGFPGERAA
jgi:5,10-methylenetetrahydrofolate reductase